MKLDRRRFLVGASAMLAGASVTCSAELSPEAETLTVAAIRHTGRGDFGHSLDIV
jgi:hypothetical protein